MPTKKGHNPYRTCITLKIELLSFRFHTYICIYVLFYQGTLPVTVFRKPPSLYRLDVDRIFGNSQDFIIFVKIKNQLRCFVITNKRLSLPFPFDLPTASTINCKIICSSRQQRIPGSHMITSTTSHSKIIVFKTCKIASLSLCKCLFVYLLSYLFQWRFGSVI